ncbi:Crp/Fnr family transcriptional regulator [Bradyrhizobium sp.]|uniref:Crp/Fnr family transcriptional regulator n=1 Tax=Bradyrhizobium sp. TaxID=376 RepID=UPI003C73CDD5
MRFAEIIGYVAALLVFLTFYIEMMVPLRIVAMCSNCAFIAYGYLDGLYPILFLHVVLLPLNAMRLNQMIQLSFQVRTAANEDLNMDWIRPFSSVQHIHVGEMLFRRGQPATHMFVIISGRFRLRETGIEIRPGSVVGELSLLAPKHKRTQTLECLEAGEAFCMSLRQLEQLFFQNRTFGFYFLKLITSRMSENLERLEHALVEREQEIRSLNKAFGLSEPSRLVAEEVQETQSRELFHDPSLASLPPC